MHLKSRRSVETHHLSEVWRCIHARMSVAVLISERYITIKAISILAWLITHEVSQTLESRSALEISSLYGSTPLCWTIIFSMIRRVALHHNNECFSSSCIIHINVSMQRSVVPRVTLCHATKQHAGTDFIFRSRGLELRDREPAFWRGARCWWGPVRPASKATFDVII